MPINPFTSGGQIAQSSTNEPEKIWGTAGVRTDKYGAAPPVDLASYGQPAKAAAPTVDLASYGQPAKAAAPRAPMNALSRGAAAGFGSALGGPVKVGSGKSVGQRALERQARRGDSRAASTLVSLDFHGKEAAAGRDFAREQTQTGHDFDLQKYGMQRQDKLGDAEAERGRVKGETKAGFDGALEAMVGAGAVTGDQVDAVRGLPEDQQIGAMGWLGDYGGHVAKKRGEAQVAQEFEGDPFDVREVAIEGTDYVIPFAGKRAMGTVPAKKPAEAGLTQDDIHAALGMGADVDVPLPGGAKAKFKRPKPVDEDVPSYQAVPGRAPAYEGDPGAPDQVFDRTTGNYYPAGQVPQRRKPGAPSPQQEARKVYGDSLFE